MYSPESISYVRLVAVATVGGITYPWVGLWPLGLDTFMCIGSLNVIRRELNGEITTIPWAVVIGVTLVSTGFNITLADPIAVELNAFGISKSTRAIDPTELNTRSSAMNKMETRSFQHE